MDAGENGDLPVYLSEAGSGSEPWWLLPPTPDPVPGSDPVAQFDAARDPEPATPAPVDAPLSGFFCPHCRGSDLVDDAAGIACTACYSLAFIDTEDGSLVRVDHLAPHDEVDADTIPLCPDCGGWYDTETLGGLWHCSKCDPEADTRRQRTRWILRLRDRLVEQHTPRERN